MNKGIITREKTTQKQGAYSLHDLAPFFFKYIYNISV